MGVPLFQEQVMKLAIDLAGFSPGESDLLRKSINAWKTSRPMGEMGDRLRRGLINGGMTIEFADQIFTQIQGFSHYGFPESHAASFALLAYASCYLKYHHPAEFACSLVNSQPMGFYRNDTIIYDAIRHGARVLPVSLTKSQWDCTMEEPNTIRLGFKIVSGLSKTHVQTMINEREQKNFTSLADFLKRSSLRSDVIQRLALASRFEDFNWSARESLWAIMEYENVLSKQSETQLSFFTHTSYLNEAEVTTQKTPRFSDLDGFEKIHSDYGAFSLSLQGHPMQELRKTMPQIPKMTSKKIREMKSGSQIKTCGLVLIRQKPPTANGTCFSTLEDEYGFIDLVCFSFAQVDCAVDTPAQAWAAARAWGAEIVIFPGAGGLVQLAHVGRNAPSASIDREMPLFWRQRAPDTWTVSLFDEERVEAVPMVVIGMHLLETLRPGDAEGYLEEAYDLLVEAQPSSAALSLATLARAQAHANMSEAARLSVQDAISACGVDDRCLGAMYEERAYIAWATRELPLSAATLERASLKTEAANDKSTLARLQYAMGRVREAQGQRAGSLESLRGAEDAFKANGDARAELWCA